MAVTTKPAKRPRSSDKLAEHRKWLKRAEEVATAPVSKGGSPHPTVRVGAVLVDAKGKEISSSSNRFAEGVDRRRPERYKDGQKSMWINCAEQLAIVQALRKGKKVQGATMYLTLEPCAVCSGLMAELQLAEVCVPMNSKRKYAKLKAKWQGSIEVGLTKLAEAGVRFTMVDVNGTKK